MDLDSRDLHSDSESEAAFSLPEAYNLENWIIDSGASSHMTQSKELFINYEKFDAPQKVSLRDGHTVEAFGKGDIHLTMLFKMSQPKGVVMHNALYVLKLACNLFSVRLAANRQNTIKFGRNVCCIRDKNGKFVSMESLADKLYYLNCEAMTQECASVSLADNKADLWHQ